MGETRERCHVTFFFLSRGRWMTFLSTRVMTVLMNSTSDNHQFKNLRADRSVDLRDGVDEDVLVSCEYYQLQNKRHNDSILFSFCSNLRKGYWSFVNTTSNWMRPSIILVEFITTSGHFKSRVSYFTLVFFQDRIRFPFTKCQVKCDVKHWDVPISLMRTVGTSDKLQSVFQIRMRFVSSLYVLVKLKQLSHERLFQQSLVFRGRRRR